MTIPSTTRKAGPLLGTGAQTTWPFTFKVFATTDILVTTADSLGVETVRVINTDYSVALNANQETSPGGTVTYPLSGSALPVSGKLTIIGNLPYDQPLDLPSGGNFSPLALENELDRLTMQVQQVEEVASRAVQVPVTSSASPLLPAPEANALLGWNTAATAMQNYPLEDIATAISFATYRFNTFTGNGSTTQFALDTDPAVLGNMDVAIDGFTQVPGVDFVLTAGNAVFTVAPSNGAEILVRYGQALVGVSADANDVSYTPAGTGAVATTVQTKLRESVSDADFGVVPDSSAVNSGTNETTDTEAAITAAPAPSLAAITGTGGNAIVGGGSLLLAASALARRIGASINITKSKIIVRGPARLNIDDGVTALLWNYIGSSDKSGVVFEYIDFVGGAIAADIGINADAMPAAFYKCNFINQTTASIKLGNFGFSVDVAQCRFSGNAKGVWNNGQASDGLNIERCVFIYNSGYDIHLTNGANVATIYRNTFVGNLAATPVNICIDTTTAVTGSYSRIIGNKFGSEGRIAGNPILITGANPVTNLQICDNPTVGFEGPTVGGFIKLVGIQLQGCVIQNNGLDYCKLFDPASTEITTGANGKNQIGPNVFLPFDFGNINRGNFNSIDYSEPPTDLKNNMMTWSRYVNAGAYFTYANATPTYMTSTDENGIANNATSVIATAANNYIRVNTVDTNNVQKKYSLWVWCKMDVESNVQFSTTRASDYGFNLNKTISTAWTRVLIEFTQNYLAAGSPYVFDIVIPNGRTITLGGVGCTPGRDVGDLRAMLNIKEYLYGVYGANVPGAAIYWTAGTVVKNSAPAVGQPKGWVCTVAGNPGTWVSEGNL